MKNNWFFATGISLFTLMSRFFGAIRDILLGITLGTGIVAEAYVVAMRVPNLVRQLFSDGAVTGVAVPVLVQAQAEGGDQHRRKVATELVIFITLLMLGALAAIQYWLTEVIILLAPGFANNPDTLQTASEFARVTSNFLVLTGITAMLSAIMHSERKFLLPAAIPALLNLVAICILTFGIIDGWNAQIIFGQALVWGVIFGGCCQVLLLGVVCARSRLLAHLSLARSLMGSVQTRTAAKRMLPAVLGTGVTTFQTIIGGIFASYTPGAVVVLHYAERLIQLPLALVGMAIASVLLPNLAQRLIASETKQATVLLKNAVLVSTALVLPATVGLVTAALPIVHTLFEYGSFSSSDASATARVLSIAAFALPLSIWSHMGVQALHSRGLQRVVFKQSLMVLLCFTGSLIIFHPSIDYFAVPLSMVIAGAVRVILVTHALYRIIGFPIDSAGCLTLVRMIVAAAVMGVAIITALPTVTQLTLSLGDGIGARISILTAVISISGIIYFTAGHFLGAFNIKELIEKMLNGLRKTKSKDVSEN